jgi:hypothetical protein
METNVKGYLIVDNGKSTIDELYKREGLDTYKYLRGDFLVEIQDGNKTIYISDFAGSHSYFKIPRNSTIIIENNKVVYLKQNINTTQLYYMPPQGTPKRNDFDKFFDAIDDAINIRKTNNCSLALSSGHDSGTIAASLLNSNSDINIMYANGNENLNVLHKRLKLFEEVEEFNESYNDIKALTKPERNGGHFALAKNCKTDVLLSGLGADELYKSGDFELLEQFLSDAEEAYDHYNLDVRYPLLDPNVYLEYYLLDQRLLKNNNKYPLEVYMKFSGFPINYERKSSFYLW